MNGKLLMNILANALFLLTMSKKCQFGQKFAVSPFWGMD